MLRYLKAILYLLAPRLAFSVTGILFPDAFDNLFLVYNILMTLAFWLAIYSLDLPEK
ncbi:TPA: hypothetical protein TUV15_000618 [Streptococcus equi subsp. zooepidemicus]|uniref:hypothetical protein n=1 Tax=Streptococcus equi TaxID=1336 RepID=UPI0005C2FA36|nr:hypothetical protein [Streptococcus equi]KIS13339.1 hypothetical protein AT48_00171 [Streptococcus equi subsp. zooepidemicus SzAM60]HEL0640096.1 hypothetical protein [Streptococcus equi subsp. zooepidemicus]HEL1178209.1 hypothetical protein [Streptococcus equi subsp. zooepidemicus]HEL1235398.1 hypothetical protein [Streptococcus equi subsp. zooepidemicus]